MEEGATVEFSAQGTSDDQISSDYLLNRIRMLGIRGEHALEVSCGKGHWSSALRSNFAKVVGIDESAALVTQATAIAGSQRIVGVSFIQSSASAISLPSNSVDAVFAFHGLRVEGSPQRCLEEFFRVLKPGGVFFWCLPGFGVLYESEGAGHGHTFPTTLEPKRDVYLSAVSRIPRQEVQAIVIRGGCLRSSLYAECAYLAQRVFRFFGFRRLALRAARSHLREWFSTLAPQGLPSSELQKTVEFVDLELGAPGMEQLSADIHAIARGRAQNFSDASHVLVSSPDDIALQLEEAGFQDFQWAPEAHLLGVSQGPWSPPLRSTYISAHLNSWELMAFKPEASAGRSPEPSWFIENALIAAELPYIAFPRSPLMTNAFSQAVPAGWVDVAKRRSRSCGQDFLKALANKLVDGATSERERTLRILDFAQRALVPHPIAQPFEMNGSVLLDPGTLLFLGIGRCGAAATLISKLCQAIGIDARVESLGSHVTSIATVDGKEMLLEANYFLPGAWPSMRDDEPANFRSFLDSPATYDALPDALGWWIQHLKPARDIWGRQVSGYIQTDGDVAIYSSYFSRSGAPAFKPRVPDLRADIQDRHVLLTWSNAANVQGQDIRYAIRLREKRRGWGFRTLPSWQDVIISSDAVPLAVVGPEPCSFEFDYHGESWVDVTPLLEERPGLFCWASNEVHLPG